ncbi:ataxin-7-like protein 3 isoform X2 [Ornithodoros turicata]|uniref:ataxin-7-like protein 3 isoform X2 n=1 Tax=Ornithodoros turicata TaxID=34597 RepID=UPI003139907F
MMQQPYLDNASTASFSPTGKALEEQSQGVLDELIDDVILGTCFEVHRSVKLGIFFLDEAKDDEKKYEIVDELGLDVFGQVPLKKQYECVCPNCQRNLAASRFAPHLEKCMGMGRNSSRIASKRIANSGKAESDVDDYDNDSDWNYTSDRKSTSKKRKDKHSSRRIKGKPKNGDQQNSSSVVEGTSTITNYESLSIEQKRTLLVQMCGVISEHTKKMCTRSHRCPQHTDEQRKAVRVFLLGQNSNMPSGDPGDEMHIDVDTFDESDTHSLQMWENVSSTNSSPADGSYQGSNGSTSKKKEKRLPTLSGNHGGAVKKSKTKSSSSIPSISSEHSTSDVL